MKKTKGFRTLLAYLLAGVMIFSAVPVWAEEPAGDGTSEEAPACTTLIRVEDGVVYVYNTETMEWDPNEELTNKLTLDGNLEADILVDISEGVDGFDLAPALDVSASEKDTSFTVEGSVIMQNDEGSYGDEVEAVRAEADGQEATLTIEEDILAVSSSQAGSGESDPEFTEEADALALEVRANGDSEESSEEGETLVTVEAGGSVSAEADASGEGYVDADAKAVKVATSGDNASSEVAITEGVSAEATAAQTDGEMEETSARAEATALEVETTGENASSVITVGEGVSAEATATAEGSEGSANAVAEGVMAGSLEGGESASTVIEIGEGISAEATATGDSEECGTEASATALYVHGAGTYDIKVEEDVTASAEAQGEAVAKAVDVYSDGGEISVQIGGGVAAEITSGDHEFVYYEGYSDCEGAYAVRAVGYEGTVTVEAEKKITATSTVSGDAPTAVEADAFGKDAEVLVKAGEGVEGQVYIQAVDGGHAVVSVEDGGIAAETGGLFQDSDAVYAYASNGGEAQISVIGDTAISNSEEVPVVNGVGLYVEDADSAITAYFEGNVSAELKEEVSDTEVKTETVAMTLENAGDMKVAVEGDVTATGAQDNFGIYVEAAEEADTDILVDGTVSAEDGAIVLSGETTKIGENVTLTVWKLEPDDDGDLVVLGTRDEETGRITAAPDGEAGQGAKEAEKGIQYIIRVDASQTELIQTTGTRQYTGANGKTYDVANEGDSILVKLNIPEGYVIDGVFWDEGQSHEIKKDDSGNYYLIVPQGGGVVLSVAMEEEKKEGTNSEGSGSEGLKEEVEKSKDETLIQGDGKEEYEAPAPKAEKGEDVNPAADQKKESPSAAPDVQKGVKATDPEIKKVGDQDQESTKYLKVKKDDGLSVTFATGGTNVTMPDVPGTTKLKATSGPKAVTELLTVWDLTNKVKMTFFSDGTYKVTYEDRKEESGKFARENGELFLVNDNDQKAEKTKMFITINPQEMAFEISFIPSGAEAGTVFTFRLTEDNFALLDKALP